VVVGVAGNGTGTTNTMEIPAISTISREGFKMGNHSIGNTGAISSHTTRIRYISIGI
jgi:hypothetical protein